MLAELAARIGRLRNSEALLRRALEISPGFTGARANLAVVLGRLGRPAEALELLDELFQAEPEAIGHLNLKAATLGRLGDFDEAIEIYAGVIERAPRQPRVWLSYGHMLKTVGKLDEGIAAYRQAIAIKPTLGEAWWSLANLKTVRFSDDDVAAMTAALAQPGLADDDRFHLDFALGKALHDAGRFDEAFAHYSAGNALRRRYHPPHPDEVSRTVERSIATFTREVLTAPGGCEARDPIFIVGMPRAGSTLVEQILASHSLVEGTSELPDMPAIARQGGKYPGSAAAMTSEERKQAGESYLQRASVQRRTDRPRFIDKLPNNWMYAPFIHLVLPKATIIDVAPPSARLLPVQLPPAFRPRAGLHLRPWRRRALLRGLRAADGASRRDAARAGPPGDLRAAGRRHRRRGAGAARLMPGWSSSPPASLSTRPSGRFARQAPSRCGSRSTGARPTNGTPMIRTWVRSRPRLARCSRPIRACPMHGSLTRPKTLRLRKLRC